MQHRIKALNDFAREFNRLAITGYSERKASTGNILAALRAGSTPAKMPMAIAIVSAAIT